MERVKFCYDLRTPHVMAGDIGTVKMVSYKKVVIVTDSGTLVVMSYPEYHYLMEKL